MKTASKIAVLLLVWLSVTAAAPYKRPSWSTSKGIATNTAALIKQCSTVKLSANGKTVVQATCKDIYAGTEISTDTPAQALQVDHVYPASEAWKRRTWRDRNGKVCPKTTDCKEYAAFFNDQDNLIVTRARTNGRKGDRMPNEWCAASVGARRVAAARFLRAAARYHLPVSPAELAGVEAWKRGECSKNARILGGDQ